MECDCGKIISRYMQGRCMKCRYGDVNPNKCVICGKPFTIGRQKKKYTCSPECSYQLNLRQKREKAEAAKKAKPPTTCIVCGRKVSGINRKFCSAKCNAKWYGSAVSGERKAMRIRQPARKQEPPKMHYEKPVVINTKKPAPRAALKCNPIRLPAYGAPKPTIRKRRNIVEYLDEREEKRL